MVLSLQFNGRGGKYLPAIYKAIKGRYPDMADYLVELAKKRKIDTSIFEEE